MLNTVCGCSTREQYIECCKQAVKEFLPTCKRVSYQYAFKHEKYNGATGERKKLGPKIGVVIGYRDESGKLFMGAAQCNLSAGDKFDRYIGLYRAIDRAMPFDRFDGLTEADMKVPATVIDDYLVSKSAGATESLADTFNCVFNRMQRSSKNLLETKQEQ